MAEDAYDSLPSAGPKTIVANACSQFVSNHGNNWMGNDYNDDIAWAVIAFARQKPSPLAQPLPSPRLSR